MTPSGRRPSQERRACLTIRSRLIRHCKFNRIPLLPTSDANCCVYPLARTIEWRAFFVTCACHASLMHSFLPSPARHMDGTWLILSRVFRQTNTSLDTDIVTTSYFIMVRQRRYHKLIANSLLNASRLREPTPASRLIPALPPSNPPSHPPTPPLTLVFFNDKAKNDIYTRKSARRASTTTPTPTHSHPPRPSARAIPNQQTSNRGPERWSGCKMSGSTSNGT